VQPGLLEEDLAEMPAPSHRVEVDLRGWFGVEVSSSEHGSSGSGLDEALPLSIEDGLLPRAGDLTDDVAAHDLYGTHPSTDNWEAGQVRLPVVSAIRQVTSGRSDRGS
jgi:hypothetical protein